MTEGQSQFADWLNAYQEAYLHATALEGELCPNCGARSLKLLFIVENARAADGTAVFWCDSCLLGLTPLRAFIAEGGKRILRGSEVIPNYTLVVDE